VVAGETSGAGEFDRDAPFSITRVPLTFPNWGLLSAGGLAAYWQAFRQVWRIGRRMRPQAIHCGKALPEGLLALACGTIWRTPYVCYVHGEELRLAHTSRDLRWLTRRVLSNASLIVANSVHSQEVLRREWGISDRVAVMHPGVDAARFVPAAPDRTARERLGWSGRQVVLTVGALQKRKGQDMMIRALPAIRTACPDVLYVIVGEGWERPYLETLVTEMAVSPAVQFRDPSGDEDLIECYQQSDLFALPNRQVGWDIEGFGIVLLEAQACGRPVLAGRSGGTVETLVPGETGEIVPCDDPAQLASAVIALLQNPDRRQAMGAAARDWVVQRFDWAPLTQQAARLFHAGASGAGRRKPGAGS
jgi:phosphatidylinositol alpha-1,6-mannosyltransferase